MVESSMGTGGIVFSPQLDSGGRALLYCYICVMYDRTIVKQAVTTNAGTALCAAHARAGA